MNPRVRKPQPNYFQASTSEDKLRGTYYTPPDLVRHMLARVSASPADLILDPSCGDGEFLVGAVHHLADGLSPAVRAAAADLLPERLVGLDIHLEATVKARRRIAAAFRERFGVTVDESRIRVYARNALDAATRAELDAQLPVGPVGNPARLLVVGNPPYVEAKRLSAEIKSALRARYPTAASGAPDLYLYFLDACLGWLRPGDRLAFVLPNKCLVNQNGRELRERILAREQLLGIDFATRVGLFPDAAVYPVVLQAGGPGDGEGLSVELAELERAGDSLRVTPLTSTPAADYAATEACAFFPTPPPGPLHEALARLLRQVPRGRLDDLLEIRWSVSFHRQGLREKYVTPTRPYTLQGRPFLGGGAFSGNGEVRRYAITWGGWWIDYDEEALRRERNQLPDPALFEAPKIVICQNGRTLRAAFDGEGYVLKDTFLCGALRGAEHPLTAHPRALVALLCSRAVHFFYSHVFHGGHVNGGYLHFLRSFLVDVPLGGWTDADAAEADRLVRLLEAADTPEETRLELETAAERLVEEAFGFTGAEREAVAEWAAGEENWLARERVRWRGNPG